MLRRCDLRLDVATGLSLGARDRQEDAVLCDVPQGGAAGILVLSDGLGGHVAGGVASRLAVATALGNLASWRNADGDFEDEIPGLLTNAAEAANQAILSHADRNPEAAGMGATLVIAVVHDGAFHWLSIGDSPLYLFRNGACRQLNEVHSLAPQLDFLARMGEMDVETAANHPDRSCLTSALGCQPLRQVDCPPTPLTLCPGDVVLAASDGILTLPTETIATGITDAPDASSSELANGLLSRVGAARAEAQDNVSVAVLRVQPAFGRVANAARAPVPSLFARLVRAGTRLPAGAIGAILGLGQSQPQVDVAARAGRSK